MARITEKGLVSRYWWIPMFTGLLAIGFGIWCLCDPSQSLPILAYVFAACMCVAGVLNFTFAFSVSGLYSQWGWSLFLGILELLCGIWMFCIPIPELVITFMYIIGIWILVVAIDGVVESCMMIKYNPWWVVWMIVMLFCTIGFSMIFLVNPVESLYIEWVWLGISLLTYGIYRICFSFAMKRLGKFTGGIL